MGELWPGARVRLGSEAEPAALRASLASADVVHVAAHGIHEPQSPLFSSLRLEGGPVFAYELDQTAGMAPHVVLSACELGQATVRPGDETLGLTSVLLALGSRSVVAGVARIPDDVCAEVMVRYHRALAAGVDSAQAIQDAGAVDDVPAPFVCFGAAWAVPRASDSGLGQPYYRRPRQLRHNGVVFIGTDEQRTRERVLAAVSEHGPVTAAEVGRLLGLTPAAVRRHLDALAEHGALEEHDPGPSHTPGHPRGRGRPARAYVVSERGHGSLPADYDELAGPGPALPRHARRARRRSRPSRGNGSAASRAGMRRRLAAAGDDVVARTDVLVEAMTEDGFAASARPVGSRRPHRRAALPGALPRGARGRGVPPVLRRRDRGDLAAARRARPAARHPRRRRPRLHHLHPHDRGRRATRRSGTPSARGALELTTPNPERASR